MYAFESDFLSGAIIVVTSRRHRRPPLSNHLQHSLAPRFYSLLVTKCSIFGFACYLNAYLLCMLCVSSFINERRARIRCLYVFLCSVYVGTLYEHKKYDLRNTKVKVKLKSHLSSYLLSSKIIIELL